MKKLLCCAALLLLSPAVLAAPDALVTRIDPASGIGETVLENGLRVLTLERHSAPVVSCQIWYRVGSADEVTGATGLSHFLEHLMFKGTDRYAKGEIDRITLRLGGSNNAATSKDWTYFYFNFASDRWETALTIEANRMRHLAFDPKEFAAERQVVLSELAQGLDSPWGRLDDTIEAMCFLAHPYHHPVIGWRTDVERVSRDTVKAYYDRHYHPRNATLVLVGDFETRRALSRALELFGPIPAGPERRRVRTPEPPQLGERRFVIERPSRVARLEILYRGLRASDPDDIVLEVIRRLLTGGKASRLHHVLVEERGLATSVHAADESRLDPGIFWIWAELQAGVRPGAVEEAIHAETRRLTVEDVSPAALTRAKIGLLAERIFGRATAEGLAEEIGRLASTADWRLHARARERIEAVTAADIKRVAARIFVPERRTVGIALPAEEGGGGGARTGSRTPPRRSPRGPDVRGRAAVRLSPRVVRLGNGLTLLVVRNTTIPVLALSAYVDAGRLRESTPGLAHLTGQYLMEGADGRDGLAISTEIEGLGAVVETSATGLSAHCLSRDASEVIGLAADILRRPDFPEASLQKLRRRIITEIRADADDPRLLCRRAFDRAVYGDHPLGRDPKGDARSLAGLTREDVVRHHRRFFVPQNTVIAAVSDRPEEEVIDLLEAAFGDWEGRPVTFPALPPLPAPAAREIHIDRKAEQVNIYLGHAGIRRNDPDYYALLVMDYVLGMGPGFTDRLSRNLRDRDGLAYDVYATITDSAGLEPGEFRAYIGTAPSRRKRAIAGIRAEIERIRREPVSEEELADAKAYLTGSFVFGYETAAEITRRLVTIQRFGLGFDYPARFASRVNAVTGKDVLRVARKHLMPDRLVLVTVGPPGK